jgi:hypothetical protein
MPFSFAAIFGRSVGSSSLIGGRSMPYAAKLFSLYVWPRILNKISLF